MPRRWGRRWLKGSRTRSVCVHINYYLFDMIFFGFYLMNLHSILGLDLECYGLGMGYDQIWHNCETWTRGESWRCRIAARREKMFYTPFEHSTTQ